MRAVTGWMSHVLVVALLLLPDVSAAQRGGLPAPGPGPERAYGRIMVIAPSDSFGDLVSEAVRRRLNSDPGTRELQVVSWEDMMAVARAARARNAATPPDSGASRRSVLPALTFPEARDLARFVRADMLVSMSSSWTPGGVQIDAWVASITDDGPRFLVRDARGSVDSVSALVINALRADSAYRQLRTRRRN
jgi:hypothetical protein